MYQPTVALLRETFAEFSDIPDDQLQFLIDHSELEEIKQGQFIFEKGAPADKLILILSGCFEVYVLQNNQQRHLTQLEKGTITGVLPFSRMTHATGFGKAMESSWVLRMHRNHFREMISSHFELTEAFVHHMNSRIRNFTTLEQQNEKMMALGKLSAGLAHELNNPASAIARSSKELKKHLGHLPASFKKVISIRISDKHVDEVNQIMYERIKADKKRLSLLERGELEDELLDVLEDYEIDDADDYLENLIEFGFSSEDLSYIHQRTGGSEFKPILKWIDDNLTTERMVQDIQDASERIAELVGSVKVFTHMDRSPDKVKANVLDGVDNTLKMLGHKIRKGNINLEKNYEEVPEIDLLVGQMNQVWTNLIDNAIDALEETENPKLTITSKEERGFVKVSIIDNGPGIPEEIQSQIFDPFYTTKDVGKGTGMGLEVSRRIVQQHQGSLNVKSQPGHTEFEVCIPLSA